VTRVVSRDVDGTGLTALASLLVPGDRSAEETVHVSFADRRSTALRDADDADVVIFGVPFDGGTHTHVGTHEGPMGVRRAFSLFRTYSADLGFDFADVVSVVDIGNVAINEWRSYDEMLRGVSALVTAVARAQKVPVMIGGDHSIAYPAVKAFAEATDAPIGLVWIDNHFDAWPPFRGDPFHCGCPLAHLVQTIPDRLAARNIVHVGSRGYGNSAVSARRVTELGVQVVPVSEVERSGAIEVARRAMEAASDGTSAVYVSIDLDAADLVFAPGTQSSRPGGLTAREMMTLVRECAVRGARAFDVVECAPQADVAGATAALAAGLVLEAIGGVAASARSQVSEASQ
jgi:agmatinase